MKFFYNSQEVGGNHKNEGKPAVGRMISAEVKYESSYIEASVCYLTVPYSTALHIYPNCEQSKNAVYSQKPTALKK